LPFGAVPSGDRLRRFPYRFRLRRGPQAPAAQARGGVSCGSRVAGRQSASASQGPSPRVPIQRRC
jgi:hypothetical protein